MKHYIFYLHLKESGCCGLICSLDKCQWQWRDGDPSSDNYMVGPLHLIRTGFQMSCRICRQCHGRLVWEICIDGRLLRGPQECWLFVLGQIKRFIGLLTNIISIYKKLVTEACSFSRISGAAED